MKIERLSAKAEDYLETILRLSETPRGARTGDIAEALDVQPSTVSAALKSLKEQGLLDYSPYGAVGLTPKGRQVAEDVSGRHVALRRFFAETLGLAQEDAEVAACGMEHDATPLVLDRMGLLGDFLRSQPGLTEKWAKVRATAKGEVTGLDIDPSILVASEKEVVEDLILAAIHDAQAKAKARTDDEMARLAESMGVPPGTTPDGSAPASVPPVDAPPAGGVGAAASGTF